MTYIGNTNSEILSEPRVCLINLCNINGNCIINLG